MKCPKCGSRAIPANLGRRLAADAKAAANDDGVVM